jgi:hypothetical protein
MTCYKVSTYIMYVYVYLWGGGVQYLSLGPGFDCGTEARGLSIFEYIGLDRFLPVVSEWFLPFCGHNPVLKMLLKI